MALQRKKLKERETAVKAKASRGGPGAQEALDELLEVATKMEAVDKKIKELEARAEAELKEAAGKDAAKYRRIISSQRGRELKEAAWMSLKARYPRYSRGLAKGDVEGFLARLEKGLGSIRVACDVAGAFVSHGGRSYRIGADREVTIQPVAAGEHSLIVRKSGYRDWQGKVTVAPKGTSSISVRLVKDTPPPKKTVSLSKVEKKKEARVRPPDPTPEKRPKVSAGKQDSSGSEADQASGYGQEVYPQLPMAKPAKIPEPRESEVKLDPEPPTGRVMIEANVDGARLLLGAHSLVSRADTPVEFRRVAPGRHPLTATKPGYEDWRAEVKVEAGQSTRIKVDLKQRVEVIVRSFRTNKGRNMVLRFKGRKVTGEYGQQGGTIEGRLAGNVLDGSWSRGSGHGKLTFTFNPDFTGFKGEWDSGQHHGAWTGWGGKVVEP